ncbi:unnamed protein product, partial [Rotaria sp. Silwood2]
NSCENDGLCVSIDDCIASNKFTCLCKESFYGSGCENAKNRIYIKLDEKILEGTTAIFVHYITAFEDSKHQHITTLKKIKYNEVVITLFVTYPFNILTAELFNKNYYLLIHDCQGYSDCENGGQCFQDNATCPSVSVCSCPDCYYGTKCQFSTKDFVLSLDYILRYHIKPNILIFQQPLIVTMSMVLTTVMFIFGSISAFLSISTFRMKKTRDVGCGFYLLVSSWISIFIVSVLIIKFWQLVLSQMIILTNRSLLTLNCILLDMILQVLLASNNWLDACVSIERIFTVFKGIKFNKSKTRFRLSSQPALSFRKHLQLQAKQNKHHLIASCALVFLALPRLIISFITGCMKLPRYSWLFLIGYLISFLPSMMTFIAYILPSETYKDAFKSAMQPIIECLRININ